jgi:hypothetical protein
MLQNQFIVGPPFMMGFPGRNHSIIKSFDGLFFFKVNLENIAPIYDLRKWFLVEFFNAPSCLPNPFMLSNFMDCFGHRGYPSEIRMGFAGANNYFYYLYVVWSIHTGHFYP